MAFDKKNPYINRLKYKINKAWDKIFDDDIPAKQYISEQTALLQKLETLSLENPDQKREYLDTLATLIAFNFAKKLDDIQELKSKPNFVPSNYKLEEIVKTDKVDLKSLEAAFEELRNGPDPEKLLDDARQEEIDELAPEQAQPENKEEPKKEEPAKEEVSENKEEPVKEEPVKEEESVKEEAPVKEEPVKEEAPVEEENSKEKEEDAPNTKELIDEAYNDDGYGSQKKNDQKEPVNNDMPELIQLNRNDDSFSDDESVIEQPKKAEPIDDKPKKYVKDLRNELIETFKNIDEIRIKYNRTEKAFSYAEHLLGESRYIDTNAKLAKDEIDKFTKPDTERTTFVLMSDGSKMNIDPEPVTKKNYDQAMERIKQNQFNQQLSVLFAGKECQKARRFWDYINPFKWGKMIAENNAVNAIRDKIQNEYHLNGKEMKAYEKLFDLRGIGLSQNFMRVDKQGNVVIEGTLGGSEHMPVNEYVQKVQQAVYVKSVFVPSLGIYDERPLVEDTLAPTKSSSAISNQLENDLNKGELQNNEINLDNNLELQKEEVKEI